MVTDVEIVGREVSAPTTLACTPCTLACTPCTLIVCPSAVLSSAVLSLCLCAAGDAAVGCFVRADAQADPERGWPPSATRAAAGDSRSGHKQHTDAVVLLLPAVNCFYHAAALYAPWHAAASVNRVVCCMVCFSEQSGRLLSAMLSMLAV